MELHINEQQKQISGFVETFRLQLLKSLTNWFIAIKIGMKIDLLQIPLIM